MKRFAIQIEVEHDDGTQERLSITKMDDRLLLSDEDNQGTIGQTSLPLDVGAAHYETDIFLERVLRNRRMIELG